MLAIILAIYAAVLSTITATIQIMNFNRDRRNIKIFTRREMEYLEIDGDEGAQVRTIVIVANAGRRPVTITSVCARPVQGPLIDLDCFPKVPIELTEGKQLSALADEDKLDLAEIESWEAHDAVGRIYRLNNVVTRKT